MKKYVDWKAHFFFDPVRLGFQVLCSRLKLPFITGDSEMAVIMGKVIPYNTIQYCTAQSIHNTSINTQYEDANWTGKMTGKIYMTSKVTKFTIITQL